MDEMIQKYWAVVFAVGGIVGGWLLGLRRAQWSLDQFKIELADLKKRVGHLETQGNTGAATLAGIAATLEAIQETLREIKSELRGKADKP